MDERVQILSKIKPRFRILDVDISAVTLQETVAVIEDWICHDYKSYIVLTGTHGIIEMQDDAELKTINNNSGLTTPDGMPVVWLGRLKGFKHIEKVYAPDIMLETFKASAGKPYKHFFYGGNTGVAEALKDKMTARFPDLNVVGTYCPPYRQLTTDEEQEIIRMINAANADIVWVGLGCPKQERWMAHFRPALNASVLIGVGAGFDFLSGSKLLAPAWIKNSGFEWFFRLLNDPKRLWPRYSKIIPRFLYLVAIKSLFSSPKAR